MKSIKWYKRAGRGEDAPIIGSLEVKVPTQWEWDSLKSEGEGWTKAAIMTFMERAVKVDAASKFESMLKAGKSRSEAEKKIREEYVPGIVYDKGAGVDRAKRDQAIATAELMKAGGMDEATIRPIIAGSYDGDVDSVLIAAGVIEDTEADE